MRRGWGKSGTHLGRFGHSAICYLDEVVVKVLFYQLCQERANCRRGLGGFEEHGVACSNSSGLATTTTTYRTKVRGAVIHMV